MALLIEICVDDAAETAAVLDTLAEFLDPVVKKVFVLVRIDRGAQVPALGTQHDVFYFDWRGIEGVAVGEICGAWSSYRYEEEKERSGVAAQGESLKYT